MTGTNHTHVTGCGIDFDGDGNLVDAHVTVSTINGGISHTVTVHFDVDDGHAQTLDYDDPPHALDNLQSAFETACEWITERAQIDSATHPL
jgi:hypothetical protein